uniref:Ribosomal protein L21 n=1 Tax=Suricata suricatta TaxID=37032 RepID=A0A673SLG1_SURSU
MTNTKGKRRGTRYMFSRPFRKHGNGHCSERDAPQVLPRQDRESVQRHPARCGHCREQASQVSDPGPPGLVVFPAPSLCQLDLCPDWSFKWGKGISFSNSSRLGVCLVSCQRKQIQLYLMESVLRIWY